MKNLLIVVDMQKGFARYEQTIKLPEKIRNLLESKSFDAVIATKFLNAPGSIYEKLFSWKRLESNEEQAFPDGYEQYFDYISEKNVYTCVNSSFIQKLCQLNEGEYPKQVFIVGADTDCCVLTIATALFENNIRPIVLTNYVDSNGGAESNAAGLLCLKRLIGSNQLVDKIITCKEDLLNI